MIMSPMCHGLPNVFKTERIGFKLMWVLFSVGMISGCSYFLNKSILDYLEYNFISSISHRYEQPTEFPTISFCSINNGFMNSSLDDILLDCSFNNENICKNNSKFYFKSFQDPIYGNCFRFNSGMTDQGIYVDILDSFQAGSRFGLVLKLNSNTNGIRLNIHNYTTSPIYMKDSGVSISPGGESFVSINRVFNIQLDDPYNKCLKDVRNFNLNSTLINFIFRLNETYVQAKCVEYCFYINYLENSNCNCNESFSNLVSFHEKCIDPKEKNSNIFMCTENYRKEFYKTNIYDNCAKFCPLECDSITYSYSSSFVEYKKSDATDSLNEGMILHIYYDELKYTLIIQEPKMLLDDFIANIGGIIGVFVGCSFLSLIEFAEMLGEVVVQCIEKRINRNRVILS